MFHGQFPDEDVSCCAAGYKSCSSCLYKISACAGSSSVLSGPILAFLSAFYIISGDDFVCENIRYFTYAVAFSGVSYVLLWMVLLCTSLSLFSPEFTSPWFAFWILSVALVVFSSLCANEMWNPNQNCHYDQNMYLRFVWASTVLINFPFALYFLPFSFRFVAHSCYHWDWYFQKRDEIRFRRKYQEHKKERQFFILSKFPARAAGLILRFAYSKHDDRKVAWAHRNDSPPCCDCWTVLTTPIEDLTENVAVRKQPTFDNRFSLNSPVGRNDTQRGFQCLIDDTPKTFKELLLRTKFKSPLRFPCAVPGRRIFHKNSLSAAESMSSDAHPLLDRENCQNLRLHSKEENSPKKPTYETFHRFRIEN